MSIQRNPKLAFQQELQTILKMHESGAGGFYVSVALTKRLDKLVLSLFKKFPSKHGLALVALGGYGRQELSFASDADIMLLVADTKEKSLAAEASKRFLHELFDTGISLGHSFRSIDECMEFRESDFDIWISLLESRFVCGSRQTYIAFASKMNQAIRTTRRDDFVNDLLTFSNARHEKYGSSTKLLEPNVKHSAGGLRDLHTVLWLMRGTGFMPLPGGSKPAVVQLLNSSVFRKLFSARSLNSGHPAFEFLLRVRNEMHRQSQSLHDSLDFLFQPQVAKGLGYRKTKTRSEVEMFMQDYYVSARAIDFLYNRATAWAADRFLRPPSSPSPKNLDTRFVLKDLKVNLRSRSARLNNLDALTAFLHSSTEGAALSSALEDALLHSSNSFRPLQTQKESDFLRRILSSDHVAVTIRRLNDLGLLERWIPEWKPMQAFFQHNVYHYYTVDEHTLKVLANAEALASSSSSFGKVFRSLPSRVPLYLGCLLHDIAKPVRIGDHEVVGVERSRKILRRLRFDDLADDVLFLVRHHLLMEQVAFRRNLNDPQTIIDFASKIPSPHHLDLLYTLTYADLAAVNKNVWTDWKESLLLELYEKTRAVLERKMTPVQVEQAATERRHAAIQELVSTLSGSIPLQETKGHLLGIDSLNYLAAFNAQEIAEHIQKLKLGEPVSAIFRHQLNSTDVTILSRDAPFALSRFCGVLSANDANIIDANVFTRDDGMVIDKFRVVDDVTKSSLNPLQCEKISNELKDVVIGKTPIEQLLERHRMKWKRRPRHFNPNIRIDVEFEDHPRFTIIDVYAPDMLGFLYKVTETMSRLGLNISFAKIATRADGIVDSFYVLDMEGKRIDSDRQRVVKAEILRVVHDLTESELVAA